jgi:hypothetical protein
MMKTKALFRVAPVVLVPSVVCGLMAASGQGKAVEEAEPNDPATKPLPETTRLLSIQLEKAEVDGAEPVVLQITLKNTTTKSLWFAQSIVWRDFAITVRRTIHKAVGGDREDNTPLTEYGKQVFLTPAPVSAFQITEIKPGQSIQEKLAVNRLFDMTLPGTYALQSTGLVSTRGIADYDNRGEGCMTPVSQPAAIKVQY